MNIAQKKNACTRTTSEEAYHKAADTLNQAQKIGDVERANGKIARPVKRKHRNEKHNAESD